jgi:hypothetical protein
VDYIEEKINEASFFDKTCLYAVWTAVAKDHDKMSADRCPHETLGRRTSTASPIGRVVDHCPILHTPIICFSQERGKRKRCREALEGRQPKAMRNNDGLRVNTNDAMRNKRGKRKMCGEALEGSQPKAMRNNDGSRVNTNNAMRNNDGLRVNTNKASEFAVDFSSVQVSITQLLVFE